MRTHLAAVACLAWVASLAPAGWAGAADEAVRVADRAALERALARARPGARILLLPGVYAGGLHVRGLRGTAARPIRIAAADPARPPVLRGGGSGLHLSGPRHVELSDLVFEGARGNGLNVDDGGNAEEPARDLVLRRLTVRDVGPRGNADGIKLSGVDRSTVRACRVERWGSSGSALDMVGCHEVTVANCHFGPARGESANGVQAKGGSRAVRIARCTFRDAGGRGVNLGGSTGRAWFRPQVRGYEAKDLVVEDCVFRGGEAAVAFVGCDGAIVRHNLIHRPRRWVLRILQETRADDFVPCRGGVFEHNLVVFRGTGLRTVANVGPGTLPASFRFAHNAWFDEAAPRATRARIRLPVPETGAVYGVDPKLKPPAQGAPVFERRGALAQVGPRPR